MSTYFLLGGAGVPNFGDELMVRQWIDFLSDQGIENITVSGIRKWALKRIFRAHYPTITLTNGIHRYLREGDSDFWDAFLSGYQCLEGKDSLFEFDKEAANLLVNASVLHLHGGGYINTLWKRHGFFLGLCAAVKAKTGCKLIGTGLGLVPFPEVRVDIQDKVIEAFNSFDLFEVRDQKSYQVVNSIVGDNPNIVDGIDDIFLTRPKTNPGVKTLHLSLHGNSSGDEVTDNLDSEFVCSFERHLFWICHDKDAEQFERLKSRFPMFVGIPVDSLVIDPFPIGPDDFMITSRFHPHLIASRSGAVGQYQYSGKSDYSPNKHGSVLKAGSRFQAFGSNPNTCVRSEEMLALDEQRSETKRGRWRNAVGDAAPTLTSPDIAKP